MGHAPVQVFASLRFSYIRSFWLGRGRRISGRFSNKRSWIIYGGITQLLCSGKAQGRFANAGVHVRDGAGSIVRQVWINH